MNTRGRNFVSSGCRDHVFGVAVGGCGIDNGAATATSARMTSVGPVRSCGLDPTLNTPAADADHWQRFRRGRAE